MCGVTVFAEPQEVEGDQRWSQNLASPLRFSLDRSEVRDGGGEDAKRCRESEQEEADWRSPVILQRETVTYYKVGRFLYLDLLIPLFPI